MPADADDELMNILSAAAQRVDPVPEDVTLRARSAIAYRRIDAELARLTADSLAGAGAMRSEAATERLLTFAADDLEVEVEVTPEGDRRRLIGQLVPTATARVSIRHADVTDDITTDELGRFRGVVGAGPISLRATWPDGRAIETQWVLV